METGTLSTDMAQAKLLQEVQTALLAKNLEQSRKSGDEFQKMVDTADQALEDSRVGQNIDLLA